jgi:hypothetical protein
MSPRSWSAGARRRGGKRRGRLAAVPSRLPEPAVAPDVAHEARVRGLTRAELLRCGVAAALGAGLPTVASASANAAPDRWTRELTRSRFAPYVGSAFFIRRPQGGHERVELVEIGDLRGARDSELAFSLGFHGCRRGALRQGHVLALGPRDAAPLSGAHRCRAGRPGLRSHRRPSPPVKPWSERPHTGSKENLPARHAIPATGRPAR